MSDAGMAVAIAGVAGSGKTTATEVACDKLTCQRVSYGDYLRVEARRRGLEPTREVLQDLGSEMITKGWDEFTAAVLSQASDWTPGESLAIDGVRHLGAIASVKTQVAPSHLVILYIDIDEAPKSNVSDMREASPISPQSEGIGLNWSPRDSGKSRTQSSSTPGTPPPS